MELDRYGILNKITLTRTILLTGHRFCDNMDEVTKCLNDNSLPIIEWDNQYWQVE